MIIISIVYMKEDILALADELKVDPEIAMHRAQKWARHIQATASNWCEDQLAAAMVLDIL